jgi:hypothetical protein
MAKPLYLADDLALPLAAVTEKLAFLGRTGSGKTYAAMKLAEEMLRAGAQVVALDAVGKWYGLRVAGAGPGFEIPVFGGLHGDFPLESTGGRLIADVLVDRGISAVLDVSQFTHAEQTRFALDFATHFYQRKKAAPSAVHVFLEECQEFVPQNAMPGEQAMLAAFERLWKLGRNFGIGGSLISQRPQEINKKALNQTGTLVVFGMTGPQERKAIEQWVSAQGVDEDIAEILPTLKPGRPHVWSPVFLGVSKTVAIAQKQTADVSSTPEVGKGAKQRPLTPIDADQLKAEMTATVQRAKADDPKELRRELARVRQELAKAQQVTHSSPQASQEVLTDADRELLERVVKRLQETADRCQADQAARVASLLDQVEARLRSVARSMADAIAVERDGVAGVLESKGLQRILEKLERVQAPKSELSRNRPDFIESRENIGVLRGSRTSVDSRARASASPAAGSGETAPARGALPPGEHATLTAALQYPDGLDRKRLGILTGYKRSSRDAYIARLSQKGLVEVQGALLFPTDAGRAALNGSFEPFPTGRDLVDYWRARLPEGERRTLEVLLGARGGDIDREQVDHATGYKRSSRDAYLVRLKARGLVEFAGRGLVRASAELFS